MRNGIPLILNKLDKTSFLSVNSFTALAHCSVESGSVLAGKYNFATDDTGTGKDDFTEVPGSAGGSIALNAGKLRITPPSSAQNITMNPGNMANAPYCYTAAMNGDFKARVHIENLSAPRASIGIMGYREDDNDYSYTMFWASGGSVWYARSAKVVSGTRSNSDTPNDYAGGDVWVEYERSGNTLLVGIADTESDLIAQSGTYTALFTFANAYATDGVLFLASEYLGSQVAVDFDELDILEGFQGTAQCLVGDQGSGTGRYMDAGSGLTFDYSTFEANLTNCTATWDVKESSSNSFDASSWNATSLTTAQLQARTNSGKRYLQLRANLTATGSSPSFDGIG